MSQSGELDAAREYLASRIDYERSPPSPPNRAFKLDRMRRLAELLGNPQCGLRIVHVAGTKGKGSTASMVASTLTASGRRTGLYTSPHLQSLQERWQVDGQLAPEQELVALVGAVRPAVEQLDALATASEGLGRPTFFEITTAMALVHFRRQGCQFAVLEVGLGGRLDATNICQPEVAVITTISFDHTQLLGSTLAAIAREKAGIIKPRIPVVTGVIDPEPLGVIEQVAAENHAPLYRIDKEFGAARQPVSVPPSPSAPHESGSAAPFDYWELAPRQRRLVGFRTRLRGPHQARNAAVALAALGLLGSSGVAFSESELRGGLMNAHLPARTEIFRGQSAVVLDAAHNVASVEALLGVLEEEFRGRRGRLIFAVSSDKDAAGILRRLAPRFESIYCTQFLHNPRSVPPVELATILKGLASNPATDSPFNGLPFPQVHLAETPDHAWEAASAGLGSDDFLCIAGSFFLAAELRQRVLKTLVR